MYAHLSTSNRSVNSNVQNLSQFRGGIISQLELENGKKAYFGISESV